MVKKTEVAPSSMFLFVGNFPYLFLGHLVHRPYAAVKNLFKVV